MAKPSGGLTKWFKEDWVDIKTGKSVVGQAKKRVAAPTQRVDQRKSQKNDSAEKRRASSQKTGQVELSMP